MDVIMEKRLSDANSLREVEKYGESSKVYTDCLIELVEQSDTTGLVHCLGGQSLIYKNLLVRHDSPVFHRLVLAFAKEGLEIAEKNLDTLDGKTISIAYSCFADALVSNGKLSEALPYFEKSLAVSTADVPEKGRLKAHIGDIIYKLGEKEKGITMIEQALADIRTGDLSAYHIRVWETGVLNGLAKIYSIEGQKEKSLEIVRQSFEIASNHHLPLRKSEAEKIVNEITSGTGNFA